MADIAVRERQAKVAGGLLSMHERAEHSAKVVKKNRARLVSAGFDTSDLRKAAAGNLPVVPNLFDGLDEEALTTTLAKSAITKTTPNKVNRKGKSKKDNKLVDDEAEESDRKEDEDASARAAINAALGGPTGRDPREVFAAAAAAARKKNGVQPMEE